MGIPADSAAQRELLSRCGMSHVQWTHVALQLSASGTRGAMGQHLLRSTHHSVDVIVAQLAEVGRPKAEEDGDGATVATLVLQIVHAVLGTHLSARDVRTGPADQLGGVEIVAAARVASRLAAVVRLAAFEADEVGVPIHSERLRILRKKARNLTVLADNTTPSCLLNNLLISNIYLCLYLRREVKHSHLPIAHLEEPGSGADDVLRRLQAFVVEAHHRLASHLRLQRRNGGHEVVEGRVRDLALADGTAGEGEGDARSGPARRQLSAHAVQMEDVAAARDLRGREGWECPVGCGRGRKREQRWRVLLRLKISMIQLRPFLPDDFR